MMLKNIEIIFKKIKYINQKVYNFRYEQNRIYTHWNSTLTF